MHQRRLAHGAGWRSPESWAALGSRVPSAWRWVRPAAGWHNFWAPITLICAVSLAATAIDGRKPNSQEPNLACDPARRAGARTLQLFERRRQRRGSSAQTRRAALSAPDHFWWGRCTSSRPQPPDHYSEPDAEAVLLVAAPSTGRRDAAGSLRPAGHPEHRPGLMRQKFTRPVWPNDKPAADSESHSTVLAEIRSEVTRRREESLMTTSVVTMLGEAATTRSDPPIQRWRRLLVK